MSPIALAATPSPLIALVDTLSLAVLGLSLLIVASRHLGTTVRLLALQSITLAVVTILVALSTNEWHLWLAAGLVIVVKGLLVPRILLYVLGRIQVRHEQELVLSNKSLLVLASGLIVLGYWVVRPLDLANMLPAPNALPGAVSIFLIGCLTMITRKTALAQIIGLMVMENGLYQAAIVVTAGMPLLVELGIFFDILVGVLVMGILVFRINQTFDNINVDQLRRLRH